MIVGEDEYLGLSGESAERCGVQDAIPIAFEGGAKGIGLFVDGPTSGADRTRGESSELVVSEVFACLPFDDSCFAGARPRVGVGHDDRCVRRRAGHRAGPSLGALSHVGIDVTRMVRSRVLWSRTVVHEVKATTGVCQ